MKIYTPFQSYLSPCLTESYELGEDNNLTFNPTLVRV